VTRRARTWWLAGGALVAVLAGLWLVDRLTPSPRGPRSSSYATAPAGLAAYASVLEHYGHTVTRLRRPVADAPPARSETLVVLDPGAVAPREARAIGRWVRGGGRLVAGGAQPAPWIRAVQPDAPRWRPAAPGTVAARPRTPGVTTVRTADGGVWQLRSTGVWVLGGSDRPLLTVRPVGRGSVWLLADASPLQNRLLGQADDAALGLLLAGRGRPVAFLETVHGYGTARGLAGLPEQVRWALAGLLLAGLVALWSAGRRLGPPEDAAQAPPPARVEYVEALAGALSRTREDRS
jgi:Domain of unknown function (DUF4350)